MHDLSLIFGMYEKCDLLFKQIGIVGKDVYGKIFYIILNIENAYFENRQPYVFPFP